MASGIVGKRFWLVLGIQELAVIAFTLVVVVVLGRVFSGDRVKLFLPLIVVLLGAFEKVFSYMEEKYNPNFLAPVDQYPGSNIEQKSRARKNHQELLKDASFYTLWFLLTATAVLKAAEGG